MSASSLTNNIVMIYLTLTSKLVHFYRSCDHISFIMSKSAVTQVLCLNRSPLCLMLNPAERTFKLM